ncbi:type II toxin-antitoxin system VapB family antitoxin [Methylobacterium sp. Gmos1]
MLSIRDQEIRTLAEKVMKTRGAPTLTAAIKLALQNEIRRAEDEVPLREQVAALRAQALAKADRPRLPALTDQERDELWER